MDMLTTGVPGGRGGGDTVLETARVSGAIHIGSRGGARNGELFIVLDMPALLGPVLTT